MLTNLLDKDRGCKQSCAPPRINMTQEEFDQVIEMTGEDPEDMGIFPEDWVE